MPALRSSKTTTKSTKKHEKYQTAHAIVILISVFFRVFGVFRGQSLFFDLDYSVFLSDKALPGLALTKQ